VSGRDEKLVQIGINRRQAIVRLATAGATATAVASGAACATTPAAPAGSPAGGSALAPGDSTGGSPATPQSKGAVAYDPRDPNMVDPLPAPWPRVMTREELETAAAICDVILPADSRSPAASQLAVHQFVDEWISAPYPAHAADKQLVRGGLSWLNTEAYKRFGKPFVGLVTANKHQICDDIASLKNAKPRFRAGAKFFDRLRYVAMLGFYTTLEGMKDLGYVGNVAALEWNPPPPQVLRHLKLV
jgi:gluconate 2-dehydrogenase gamma chain